MDSSLAKATVERLLQLPRPFSVSRSDARWTYLDGSGFTADHVPGLISVIEAAAAEDEAADAVFVDDSECAATITAWRLLARLQAVEAIPALLRYLNAAASDSEEGDWEADELPEVFAALGQPAVDPLTQFADDVGRSQVARVIAVHSLKAIGDRHPQCRDAIARYIVFALENAAHNPAVINSSLLMLALDWNVVEAAEPIERAFSNDVMDVGMAGDWEAVREQLQVPGLGLPMPEKPYNSLEELRRSLGIGCFSDSGIFNFGELDEEAAEAYVDNACRAFAASPEGRSVLGAGCYPGFVRSFLELAVQYCGVTVDTMTTADLTEVLLELYPRKVSMDASESDRAINELEQFWRFCNHVHSIAHAATLAEKTRKLSRQFHDSMGDRTKFGMAKSLLMAGRDAGFDMSNPDETQDFLAAHNQSVIFDRRRSTAAPAAVSVDEKRADRKQRKKILASKQRSKKKR